MLLLLVQIKNFCSAQTTNERFSRIKKPNNEPSRGSESSTESYNGNADPEIQELTGKHAQNAHKKACCSNCWEF